MNAVVAFHTLPTYDLFAGQVTYKWGISADYQLEDSSSFKSGSPFVVWDNFNTPLSEIISAIKSAVIADALTQYSATVVPKDITVFSFSAL